MAAAAIAIHLTDGGPALYRQERIGKDGEPFELLKLRTMSVGAEYRGTGIVVSESDPRITRPGRLLRASSLDELPQMWNVLRGEMSLVGPRPTVKSQVDQYNIHQRRRLEVRPGLTGWAQVNGRNALPWDQRIELDIWYVDNKSIPLDLRILALTPKALLMPSAIYGQGGTTPDFESTEDD
ncbi:lipopolysaccharide/colanic/teichoic acid biosynthesis glycosyltransferase [Pseudarthrobacter siccitolerans]|uniref:Lipopolysaccharide/colanic/teichoic acid biosynthesis glycosyltransferase n=2 Tax=Pseudarthrobacter siccitolerans TaxID=861266 RepID=A0ABU0PJ27_9MICC|nr:lipopolysaccharide/colanic/teichoic acid biosynthesis glycosyltransferase [Pseudarthrobacter siccitolerans]